MVFALPDYANVTPADVDEACGAALERCEAQLAQALRPGARPGFRSTVLALEEARLALVETHQAWLLLAQVSPDAAVRTAARAWVPRLQDREERLRGDERVHAVLTAFAATPEAAALTGQDALLLRQLVEEQRRAGAGLPPRERARLAELMSRISQERAAYRARLQDWSAGITVTGAELDGLPGEFAASLEEVDGGRRVTLAYPQLRPFLAHATCRDKRRELMTRDQCKGGPENVGRLERIVALRAQAARLLGHASWADLRMHDRMAGSRPEAVSFLSALRERLAPRVAAERARLAEAAGTPGGAAGLAAWDEAFAVARLKERGHAVDDLAVAEYFPLPAVLEGLFAVCGTLFGLRFSPAPDLPVWHPGTTVVDVLDGAGDEQVLGQVYFDLFPRPNKYGHAMTAALRTGRRLPDGSWQKPVAALVTNLTPPRGERPSLLTHREVITLFHEFGHAVHWVLSRAEHGRHAGECEMDFMEVPSQLLEHWAWEPSVLRGFARHHATGEPLPRETLEALVATRTVASAVTAMRTLLRADFDMALHGPDFAGDSTALLREVSARCGLPYVEEGHFHSGWTHVVGHYDAGYYSYLWSRSIADDLYTRFAGAGPLDRATGAALRREVMEPGGTVPAAAMVRAFLGRDHDTGAYLRGFTPSGAADTAGAARE